MTTWKYIIEFMKKKLKFAFIFFMFLATALNFDSIHIWDEAIYANNALEMSLNHNFLVLYNNGIPDLYNVKPPLVIWLQCICIWLLGANEIAVRVPSLLAGFLTLTVIYSFFKKYLNQDIGIYAIIILLSIPGYNRIHVLKSGDLDATLVFFIVSYSLLFLDMLLSTNFTKKQFILLGILFFLAFLSKSVAALLPLPSLFVIMIYFGSAKIVLQNMKIYVTIFSVFLLCIFYYFLTNYLHNGYFNKVYFSEFSRFTQNIMPWHEQPWYFYFKNIYSINFQFYIFLLPIFIFTYNSIYRKIATATLLFSIIYLAFISYPTVKLDWYDAPIYPIISIGLAIGIYCFFDFINLKNINLRFILFLIITFFPLYNIYSKKISQLPIDPLEYDGYAIRELKKIKPELKNYKVLLKTPHIEHKDQVNFYIKSQNLFDNYNIELVSTIDSLQNNDLVLCSQVELIDSLKNKFKFIEIIEIYKSTLYEIHPNFLTRNRIGIKNKIY